MPQNVLPQFTAVSQSFSACNNGQNWFLDLCPCTQNDVQPDVPSPHLPHHLSGPCIFVSPSPFSVIPLSSSHPLFPPSQPVLGTPTTTTSSTGQVKEGRFWHLVGAVPVNLSWDPLSLSLAMVLRPGQLTPDVMRALCVLSCMSHIQKDKE